MNGAEILVRTLVTAGVEVCLANPGTSEMQFIAALDVVDGMRPILTLFEGVATGAADGYGRIAEKPAATLTHLGPGFANGIANLHNARRAAAPIVNIVGDHATYHAQFDAPLQSDIIGLSRCVSAWTKCCSSADTVSADAALAVQAACTPPGQISTLILPADVAWGPAASIVPPLRAPSPACVSSNAVDRVSEALLNGRRTAILLRDRKCLTAAGLEVAGRIAHRSGARLLCDTFVPKVARGAGVVSIERIPYFAEQITKFLENVEQLVLVGARPPVTFFAYPGKPSWCTPPDAKLLYLSHAHEDGMGALAAVAESIGARSAPKNRATLVRPGIPTGRLDAAAVGQIVAQFLPENAIISDEAATAGAAIARFTASAPCHDQLSLTGGAIGQGVPVATGAAVAAPDRKIVALQGDGGGMYTLQALWTQARERLDVTTVILANRSYAILNIEFGRVGASSPGPKALSMLDLSNPELDWVALAKGHGVEGSRATTSAEFAAQFSSAMTARGPRLIEAVIDVP